MPFKQLVPAPARRLLRSGVDAVSRWHRSRLSYNEIAINQIAEYHSVRGATVLVVGASGGEDCKRFVRRGAAAVHGLDIAQDIGCKFTHARVHYHRESIEKSSLPDATFDIVFSIATMEHVPDIDTGFAEMARLLKPGGLIYSVAAPLWQSPWGHHMACFGDHPWVHLLFSEGDLAKYALANGINSDRGHAIESVAKYMLDPANFNMKPGGAYLAASERPELEIIENRLHGEPESLLDHPLGQRALAMGFAAESLLATQHRLIARKR